MNKLLAALERDCTLTDEQLSAIVDKPLDEVIAMRLEAEQNKLILGYKAIVDWDRTNDDSVTALIEVKVTPQRGDGFDRIAERIYQHDEVQSCYLMSGGFDMCVTISGRSLKQVAQFVGQKLATIDGVTGTATHFILKKYKERNLIFKVEKKQEEGFYFT